MMAAFFVSKVKSKPETKEKKNICIYMYKHRNERTVCFCMAQISLQEEENVMFVQNVVVDCREQYCQDQALSQERISSISCLLAV